MKKLKYEMHGPLLEKAFPKELIKSRTQLIKLILETCRFMMFNRNVEHADSLMMLVVQDMNRLFFCADKKMYSIVFPFHVKLSPDKNPYVHFDLDDIDIDSAMISYLSEDVDSDKFESGCSLDFFEPILSKEDFFSKDFWFVLRHLMTYEMGYVRCDDDIQAYNEACKKGVPKLHPRYHYDINCSQSAAFKIGVDKKLTPDKFVDFLDDTIERKFLR